MNSKNTKCIEEKLHNSNTRILTQLNKQEKSREGSRGRIERIEAALVIDKT